MLCERFIGRFQHHYGGAGRPLNTHDLCKLERVLAPECQPFKGVFFFPPPLYRYLIIWPVALLHFSLR